MKKRAVSLLLALMLIVVVFAISFISLGAKVIGQGPNNCKDSDSKDDIYIKGLVTLSNQSFADECYKNDDSYVVKQYSCSSSDSIEFSILECPNRYGCLNDGACYRSYGFSPNHQNEVIHRSVYWRRENSHSPFGNWTHQDLSTTVPYIAKRLFSGADWYIGSSFTPIDYSTVPVTALYGCCSVNGKNTNWSGFIPADYDCNEAVDGDRWHVNSDGEIKPGREKKYYNNGSDYWSCGWVIEKWKEIEKN